MQACFAKKNLWLCLYTLKLRCFKLSFDYPKFFFLYIKRLSKYFYVKLRLECLRKLIAIQEKVQVD